MRIRSIGTKLTLWYTSLLTVTSLVLGGITYGLLVYNLSHDMDSALKGVGDVIAQRSRAEGTTFFSSDIDAIFRRFLGYSPLDRYFGMFDPLGRNDPRQSQDTSNKLSLSPTALENAAQGIHTFETVKEPGPYPIRILTLPVVEGGRVVNLVQVGMSLENMYRTRRRFFLTMAAVFPLVLLLAGGGGCLLARRALKPVDRMRQEAERIGGEHLNERLHETGTGDELDRLAKTLNDMLGRLYDSFHQMRRFSADASHELQTPLTILKGEVEVALRSQRSPEEYQRVLHSGLEEINRISHLVEGLLLLARSDAGVLRLDRQPVELNKLLLKVCEMMQVLAEERHISLHTESLEPVIFPGDREHLRRLLLNLVDNAVKYTPEEGRVTLSLQTDMEWISLSVTDTGIGLTEEEQAQVFNRFHRSTEGRSRDEKGVGLGLSIARSIAEAHGGKILVESIPGRGSSFRVLLPADSRIIYS